MARRRFFVDLVRRGHAEISGEDARHLTRVLRVEAGQKFEISDNHDVYLAEVETAHKDLVSFAVVERIAADAPVVHTALFASLIKFERFEMLIEKATELGMSQITPVESDRSEKGLERAARKRLDRWNRIAREASEQSRRSRLPEITEPMTWPEVLRAAADYRYVLEESEAVPILTAFPRLRRAEDHIALLVGPEGGWTDRERAESAAAGWASVSLGAGILRAETAAIAALAVINAAWTTGEQK